MLGALAFAQPWLLLGLLGLPALWWLLRLVPPPPREVEFPPVRFLLLLARRETTARRTPLWLLLLRLAAIAALILAGAQPLWNATAALGGRGPLVLVVDDGWGSAPHWRALRERATAELERAAREGRDVVLLTTAPGPQDSAPTTTDAAIVAERVAALEPRPWWPDRAVARAVLEALDLEAATSLWLSDGIARDGTAVSDARALGAALAALGPVRVVAPDAASRASVLVPTPDPDGGLALALHRADGTTPGALLVRALGGTGEVLGRNEVALAAGEVAATTRFDLPQALAERVRRFERAPVASVGDVVLTDQGLGARTVGIIATGGEAQPLLAERFFIERALAGRARVTTGSVGEVLEADVAAVVLADDQELSVGQEADLRAWIEGGGVLLRFAGPNLAERVDDPLVPVRLRAGGRLLDGALSWSEPLALGRFASPGPLAGLPISPDVRVRRQVLAEPAPELADATLAVLADGTPLVTGRPLDDGWLMLVHTTANTQWTDLALSGTFVALLERVADLGRGRRPPADEGMLRPVAVMDAFGRLGEPGATLGPVAAERFLAGEVGPARPPGIYENTATGARRALNLAQTPPPLTALAPSDYGRVPQGLAPLGEVDLRPWLLLAALVLLLVDLVAVGLLRGVGRRARRAAAAVLLAIATTPVAAQSFDPATLALTTPLAYVRTGDREVDRMAAAGLEGLAITLWRRTSIEPSDPVAVDLARDPLDLFPILFWPLPQVVVPLDAAASERLLAYLENGGMIVFDTRDANLAVPGGGGTPGMQRLQTLLRDVELPALERVGGEHALTKSFYLLQDFPGRFAGQAVWVDRPQPGVNDGVSAIVIGANDWLGAWAVDDREQALLPTVPGGERQREMARRVGVNLVMYALTGNYKTDQVHVPTLLERLGQ